MKTLAIYFGKKYALAMIRDAVTAKKDEVSTWATRVKCWLDKIALATAFLNALAQRLADGEVTDEEADATIEDAKKLATEITK